MILSKRRRRSFVGPELMSIVGGRFGEPPLPVSLGGLVTNSNLLPNNK